MKQETRKTVYCPGIAKDGRECPIRKDCAIFKLDINLTKDLNYYYAPYDFERQKCSFKK